MYNVVIADDEKKFRDFMSRCLEDEEDIQVVGCAKNGMEVLEIVDDRRVDLVLLDINMPIMDGLMVAEQLKKNRNEIFVVLVTGYNEFEYARQAIKLGVKDYILKPFSKSQLLMQIAQIIPNIRDQRDSDKDNKRNTTMAKDSFVLNLLVNESSQSEEKLEMLFQKFELPDCTHRYHAAVIEILNHYRNDAEDKLWVFSVMNIINEMRDLAGEKYIVKGMERNRICVLYNYLTEEKKGLPVSYTRVCQYCKRYLGLDLIIGVGTEADKLSGIHQSYKNALEAVSNAKLYKKLGVTGYKHSEKKEDIGFDSMASGDRITTSLRAHDLAGIENELENVKSYLLEKDLTAESIYVMLLSFITGCLSYVKEMGVDIREILGHDFHPVTEIKQNETMEDLFEWTMEIFRKVIRYFSKSKITRSKIIVVEVKKYIDKHYADPLLRAEDIAKSLYLDSSYIRKVLSKEMGTSVVELITLKRMEVAREILLNEKIKLSSLAERVGYHDPKYFGKCFRKHYGISIRDFTNLITTTELSNQEE